MASLNSVTIIGRLGQDPKLSYLASGKAVCNLNVATDESYKGQDGQRVEKTEWHKVQVWGNSAEYCANYLLKGSMVCVEGKLQTRKYQAKDGSDRYITEVIAQRVQGLDGRREGGPNQGVNEGQNRPKTSTGAGRDGWALDDGLGPAFPSEAGSMNDVPFMLALIPVAALLASLLNMGGVA